MKINNYLLGCSVLFFSLAGHTESQFSNRIMEPATVTSDSSKSFWGSSLIKGDDGKYNYFVDRWDGDFAQWATKSRIFKADPALDFLGPFSNFTEITALTNTPGQEWAKDWVHGPTVYKFNGRYYMYYAGAMGSTKNEVLPNRKIGVAVADSPSGPWIPNVNNPILDVRSGMWDSFSVTNATVFFDNDMNIYRMLYKGRNLGGNQKYGMATSSNPIGPWTRLNNGKNGIVINHRSEDATAWRGADGKFYVILKSFSNGQGKLYSSTNGKKWIKSTSYSGAVDLSYETDQGSIINAQRIERHFVSVDGNNAYALTNAVKNNGAKNIVRKLNNMIIDDSDGTAIFQGTGWNIANSWQGAYNNTRSYSKTVNDYVDFTFSGAGIKLFSQKNGDNGIANITLNQGSITPVDLYSPSSIQEENTPVYEASGLCGSSNTIRMTVTGNKNLNSTNSWVVLDSIEVLPSKRFQDAMINELSVIDDNAPSSVLFFDKFNTPQGNWVIGSYWNDMEQNTRSFSKTAGDYVEFTFSGTGVRLFSQKRKGHGLAEISIDGGAATIIDLYAPLGNYEDHSQVFEKIGLCSGSHTLRITVKNKKNNNATNTWVVVDSISVLN